MHMVFVTEVFPPDNGWGGIGTYVYHLSQALLSLGHKVTVVCGFKDEKKVVTKDHLRVIRQLNTGKPDMVRSEVCNLLEQLLIEDPFDVVEFAEYDANGLEFQRQHPNIPTVVKLHMPTEWCCRLNNGFLRRFYYGIAMPRSLQNVIDRERESAKRAHFVISPSKWLLHYCMENGWTFPANHSVVPNIFCGWSEYSQPSTLERDNNTVVFLGRLNRLKGADLIPAIMNKIWVSRPATHFKIIGQDCSFNKSETWSTWIKKHVPAERLDLVEFCGGVPYDNIPYLLQNHLIACNVSTFESFSYAVVDTMMMGLACVIAAQGGAQEIGTHGVSCLKSKRKVESISQSILQLLDDKDMAVQIGESAKKYVQEFLGSESIGKTMEKIYSQAIAEAGA